MREVLCPLMCAAVLAMVSICNPVYAQDGAVKKYPVCPGRDFSGFIQAFSESREVQQAFTRYPLQQLRLDSSAEPEPKPVVSQLGRDQVVFPVLPNAAERKQQSLRLSVEKRQANSVKLTLLKADSGYQVSYVFRRTSCWQLVRMEDWSL